MSNAVLSRNATEKNGKAYVTVNQGKDKSNLTIASLTPNRHEVQPLDLYLNISQNITLNLVGKNEVHLSGYFEPNNTMEDQLYGNGMDEDDEDEDVSDDEIARVISVGNQKGDLDQSLKAAKKNALKNTIPE